MNRVDPENSTKPLFGTQGGGLVEEVAHSGVYRFVEAPEGFRISDTMPEAWDIIPANDAARRRVAADQFGYGLDGV